MFWEVPDDPRGSLRWSLSRLRAVLDEGEEVRILADRETVALDTSRCSIDLLDLRTLDRNRLGAVGTTQLAQAAEAFRGEFLEGLDLPNSHEFQSWCLAEREDLRRFNTELLAELRRRHEMEPEAALGFVRRLVHLDPFDEEARVDLLRLLMTTRRRREAQGQFETAERLFRELGEGSAERLRRAWRTILREAERSGAGSPQGSGLSAPPPHSPKPFVVVPQEVPPAPLVGRDATLQHLIQLLERAPTVRALQVFLLVGEPGLGKSRLVIELAEHAVGSGVRVLLGHCYDTRLGASYGPWEEALHGLPSSDAVGDPELRRQRLFQAVAAAVMGDPESTLLLGLEDIQWMDEASCDVLRFVLRTARTAPLLVLLTAREGEVVDNSAITDLLREIRQKCLLESHRLLPLEAEQIRQLVEAATPGRDVDRILTLSQGNPLYALELARGLIDQQSLPGSLKELIRERLERLAPEAAELLRWVSLFSAGAASGLLQALSGMEMDRFLRAVEVLERHRLLVHDGDSDVCIFGHELVRQAVYTSLSEPRRRLMHRKIARLLNEEPYRAEGNPFDVVHHAAAAGDNVMAAQACVDAGRRAARLFANAEALMLVRRGQHHVQFLPEPLRCERLIELAEIELSSRPLDEPESFARRLEQLAGTALDHDRPEQAWRCYKMMAHIRWTQGSWSDARRDTLHAEVISRSASETERVSALGEAARCLTMLERDLDFAEALVLEARALSQRLGVASDAIADASGLLEAYRGEVEEARLSFLQARLLARRRGDRLAEFLALSHLVMLELEQENWDGVSSYCEDLAALAAKIRPGGEQPFAAAVRALCHHIRASDDDVSDLRQALQALRVADSKHHLSIMCLNAARLFWQRGRAEEAQQLASEALEAASALNRRSAQAAALALLVEIAAATGADATPWNQRLLALGAVHQGSRRGQGEKLAAG